MAARRKPFRPRCREFKLRRRFPELAKQARDVAFIRSVNSREGAHPRAQLLMHTGYLPMATVKYPTLGSLVCA